MSLNHHSRVSLLKQYLLLIRLPNIFTVPPDIVAGYSAAINPSSINVLDLIFIIVSSSFLYISGIVLNDIIDIEKDKNERPSRPLASGKVAKKIAFLIVIVTMSIGNVFALWVSLQSFFISLILSCTIIAYDYSLKKTSLGFFTMGLARGLNILLGSSLALFVVLQDITIFTRTLFIFSSMVTYVSAITLLSRRETTGTNSTNQALFPFLIIFLAIVIMVLLTLMGFLKSVSLIFLTFFAVTITYTFKQVTSNDYSPLAIQKAIRNMVISIVVLDCFFISGSLGLYYASAVALFAIPSMIFAKKLYVT